MNPHFQITIPIKLISEANNRDHWTKKSKRSQGVKFFVRSGLMRFKGQPKFPCIIKLTRIGIRALDDDNLGYSFKAIRDTVADFLLPGNAMGRADSDPRITWQYAQEKSKIQGVRIEIWNG